MLPKFSPVACGETVGTVGTIRVPEADAHVSYDHDLYIDRILPIIPRILHVPLHVLCFLCFLVYLTQRLGSFSVFFWSSFLVSSLGLSASTGGMLNGGLWRLPSDNHLLRDFYHLLSFLLFTKPHSNKTSSL